MRIGGPLAPALLLLVACSGGTSAPPGGGGAAGKPLEFPVEVAAAATRRVEYSVAAVGSVEAFETVQVTARVPGAVEKVLFEEGDAVREGQVLVEVEPQRYRLAVEAAQAAQAKAEASLADARAGLARREAADARRPGLIKAEDLESFRTRTRVAEAEVDQARAALAQAELNLKDALVRAPRRGTIETRSVQTGQYVQAGAVLATLVRREPLLVRFQVPEQEAAALRAGLPAALRVPGSPREFEAVLTHVAGKADESSRMVAVTGRIDDPGRGELRPGAFAQVRVPVGASEAAPVIPQTAVRPTERGFVAFVVEDGVARERILKLGLRTQDGLVEVRSGLAGGETLVVRGAEALREGARVVVQAGGES